MGRLVLLVLVLLAVSGCIRPDKATPTPDGTAEVVIVANETLQASTPTELGAPQPTQEGVATTPPPPPTLDPGGTAPPTQDPAAVLLAAIEQYFVFSTGQQLPAERTSINFWNSITINTDTLQGFTFNNPSGLPCVGVAAVRNINGIQEVYTAGYHCATDIGLQAIAAQWLMDIAGVPVVAISGRVVNSTGQNVVVQYQNGDSTTETLQNGNFLVVLRENLNFASSVIGTDAAGNSITLPVPMNP
ncbi:MAG: hypothetical protein L0154_10770 [Chloroflexi bacterium]|nr:hypothetical protein [Chloroflexota bacterium]